MLDIHTSLKLGEGSAFNNRSIFETCESGGNNNTLLPPEIMYGDGDDQLRFVAPYELRGSIESPDGAVRHQLEPLRAVELRYITITDVGSAKIGFIALRTTLN